jgi:hypothetical protein
MISSSLRFATLHQLELGRAKRCDSSKSEISFKTAYSASDGVDRL